MKTGVLKNMVTEVIDMLRQEKISGSVLAFVVLLAWYAYGWAGEEFVSADEFKQLNKEFKELNNAITDHVDDMKIVNASQLIRDKELSMQLGMAVGLNESEMEHLESEIRKAKEYRKCLIDQRPNCKHLKPPE